MISFLFDGHILNLVNLDYDIYISYTIAGALVSFFVVLSHEFSKMLITFHYVQELPADFLVIPLTDNFGRKLSGFASLSISGIAMILSGMFIGNLCYLVHLI